jgi:serine protease DegQ
VVQGGPADKAGVKPGDVLVSVDNQSISDTTALLNAIAQLKPGAEVKMKVIRRGKPAELTVTIGKRPPPPRRPMPLDEEE